MSRTILLIQVNTADETVDFGSDEDDRNAFADTVFSMNDYSVSSQWNSCSDHRAERLIPYDAKIPVHSVFLNQTSSSYTRNDCLIQARSLVADQLSLDKNSGLRQHVDHAIFCLPPSLYIPEKGKPLRASAPVNSFWIVANATEYCTNPSVLLHELLHNRGLHHASLGALEYGDETSIMGMTYQSKTNKGRYRCLNGANLWKMGWFANQTLEIEVVPNTTTATQRVALASYIDPPPNTTVVVKVWDLYLVYNRRISYNRQTGQYPDAVTIVRQESDGFTQLLDGLDAQHSLFRYYQPSFAVTPLTIQVCNTSTKMEEIMQLAIGNGEFPCAEQETVTTAPTTSNPTAAPTLPIVPADPRPSRSPISSVETTTTESPTHTPTSRPVIVTVTLQPSMAPSLVSRTVAPSMWHRSPPQWASYKLIIWMVVSLLSSFLVLLLFVLVIRRRSNVPALEKKESTPQRQWGECDPSTTSAKKILSRV